MDQKFIAFCSVDFNEFKTGNVRNPVTKVFTSYPLGSKEEVQKWIDMQVEKFPGASVNCYIPGCSKHISTGFVVYDPKVSENFEFILKILTTRIETEA